MDNFEIYKNNVINNKFSEGSGIASVVTDKIKMEMNDFGEYVEVIDEAAQFTKEEKELVLKVSPMSNDSLDESIISKQLFSNTPNISYNKRIGYYLQLLAGHVTEGDYRSNGSSGGFGTWILKELFERNLIDGVIHVKESDEDGQLFKYDISYSIEEIKKGSKTKYYPVEYSEVLKKVKERPGKYAIIGIPSFIMGVRLLAEEDSIIKERIRFTIGLVCGHQKSSKFADYMGWQVGIKPGNLTSINFRKKLDYGPASSYAVEMHGIINGENVKIIKPTKELLGQDWGEGFFKLKTSDYTDDVMNETADLTIGDAWLPNYVSDNLGNNIIVVRDTILNNIINEGICNSRIKVDNVSEEDIIKSQYSHYKHTQDELPYRLNKKDKLGKWRPTKRVEASEELDYFRKKVQDLREQIAMRSHILFKEAVDKEDIDYFNKEMIRLHKKYRWIYRIIFHKNRILKKVFRK